MDERTLQRGLAELIAELGPPPEASTPKELSELLSDDRKRGQKVKEAVSPIQESLDFVRLCIKYLLFDLEATRRENEELRKLLDQQGQGGE